MSSYWIAPQTDDEIAGIIAELDYNEDGTVNVVEFVTEGEAASVGELRAMMKTMIRATATAAWETQLTNWYHNPTHNPHGSPTSTHHPIDMHKDEHQHLQHV